MKWLERDDRQEVTEKPKWSPEPTCSCRNNGDPYLLDGVMVISRNPACRVHPTTLSPSTCSVSVERLVGNWNGREKDK
jgi:hypothetical protein